MDDSMRVLLAMNDPQIMREVCRIFAQAADFSVVDKRRINGELASAVRESNPDILVLEYDETDRDTRELLRNLQALQEHRPKIIAISDPLSREDAAECVAMGTRFLIYQPIDGESLLALARNVNSPEILTFTYTLSKGQLDAEAYAARLLLRCRIPNRMLGYRYLLDCILAVLEDETLENAVTKVLYPAVARRHQTTGANVERNIRNAIRKGWERLRMEEDAEHRCSRRPTNQKFVIAIAELVRMEMRRRGMLPGREKHSLK